MQKLDGSWTTVYELLTVPAPSVGEFMDIKKEDIEGGIELDANRALLHESNVKGFEKLQSVSEGGLKLVIHDEGHDLFTICQDLGDDECMILLELPRGEEEIAKAFIDFLRPYLQPTKDSREVKE